VFDFERIKVYEKGLDFIREIFNIAKYSNSDYQFSLSDQLRRVALFIVNNIGEGSGKVLKREKV
jgi:four helix bundle protein